MRQPIHSIYVDMLPEGQRRVALANRTKRPDYPVGDRVHVLSKLGKVGLLLSELLPELEELFLLALADGVVLLGALTLLEGVSGRRP